MDYRKEVKKRKWKKIKQKKKLIIAICVLAVIFASVAATLIVWDDLFGDENKAITEIKEKPELKENHLIEDEQPAEEQQLIEEIQDPEGVVDYVEFVEESKRGFATEIPEDIKKFMEGKSMPAESTVGYEDLMYLTIPHIDFDGERAVGNMIVAKELAEEVLDIFEELYEIEYPIESMKIVDEFFDKQTDMLDSPDRASMGNNNTSSFYFRKVSGSNNLSNHAYGRAIDLNPLINPYVTNYGKIVSPANAGKYAKSRKVTAEGTSFDGWSEVEQLAFIGKDTEVYRIFTDHGWSWLGDKKTINDYQHFEKPH